MLGWLARSRLGGAVQVLIIAALLAVVAGATGGQAGIQQATVWLVFGLFAIGVDFLWGYCGLLSFGQAVFFGLGAYCYAWLTTDTIGANMHAVGSLLGVVAAIVVPALLALLLGYFLFYGKVVGAFFAIVMLALSFLMQSLGQGLSGIFGGYTGIPDVPGLALRIGSWQLSATSVVSGYVVVAVATAIVTFALRSVLKTPFGLLVDGVRDDEERLTLLGQKTVRV
jgi:ABC-type branched-subunit amino acid transport system permease subunit